MKKTTILTLLMIVLTALQIRAQYAPISTIDVVNTNLTTAVVPISCSNFSNITDCSLKIIYNPAIVNATGVTAGPSVPGTIYAITSSPGVIEITWFTWPSVYLPDNSVIFNLAFSKVASGTSAISFDDNGYSCLWGDGNYNELIDIPTSTYYINGSLTFGMAPVTTAPVVPVCTGTIITVPVTVSNFDNIGQIYGLKMLYNSSVLTYQSYTNTSGFPGLTVNGSTPGVITIPPSTQSPAPSGISYPDNTVLFTMDFLYLGGSTDLTWSDNGNSCLYRGPSPAFTILVDSPTSTFYQNGSVAPLVPPTIIRNPVAQTVCTNTQVSATFTAGSGGVSPQDHYEYSVDAGNSWQAYIPGSIITGTSTGASQIQVRAWRTSGGTGCTNSGYSTTTWDVVQGSEGGMLAGSTTVCAGSNSTILNLSGYTGSIVKWQSSSNGIDWSDIANTSTSFTVDNLLATMQYRVVVTNGTCDPAYSSVAIVTVNQIVPVGVSIAADANPSCNGTTVTFTATPVNGGTNPMYQWRLNGSDVTGATNALWVYIPANNDQVTCTLNSNEICTTGNPATSGILTMSINPLPLVTAASIQSSLNSTGPWSPVNGDLTTGYNLCIDPAEEFYYLDLNTLVSTQPLLPDFLNPFTVVQSNLPPTWLSYWAGRGVNGPTGNQYPWQDQMWQIIHGFAPVFYIHYSTGGDYQLIDGLTYQLGGGQNPLRLSGDYPQWNYQYSGAITDVNYCVSSFFDVFLELNTIPVMLDATLQVSTNPTGPWSAVNGDLTGGYNLCIDPGIEYYYMDINTMSSSQALLTNNLNPFALDTTNLPPSWLTYWAGRGVHNSTGNQYPWQDQMWQIIHGLAPIFYLNYTVGGDYKLIDGLTHQLGGGEIALRVSGDYPQWNYTYSGSVIDLHECPSSFFDIFMEFNSIPNVNPVENQSYCDGEIAPDVILSGNVPGTTFTWENDHPEIGLPASGVGEIPAFYAMISGETPVTATITVTASTNECTSGPIALYTIRVSPIMPAGVTIACGNETVCEGTAVTYNTTVAFGGTEPTFKWYVNAAEVAGATNSTFTYVPSNLDIVTCEMTSSDRCATDSPAMSNEILMTVNELKPVSITITGDKSEVCAGTPVAFSSFVINGGTSPAYQWFVNAIEVPGATSSTFTYNPVNADQISCQVTSDEACAGGNPALSNILTMNVIETKPVSVVIAADDPDVCVGSVVTFTATAINGGMAPTYRWFVNASEVSGATGATYDYVPLNLDAVTCEVTSSENICVTGNPAISNEIVVTVSELKPVSVTIAADASEVCAGTTVTFTASAINGGASPAYRWFVNSIEIPGATGGAYTYVPLHLDVVSCEVTSDEGCATGNPAVSNEVTITVNELKLVSVTIAADDQEVCSGTLVTFTATTINGGVSPAYKWFVNTIEVTGATDAVYAYIPADSDVITCMVASDVLCATGNPAVSNAISLTVYPLLPVGVSILPDANPVYEGMPVTLTAIAVNGGTNPGYQWKVNTADVSGATNETFTFIPANNDAIVCVLTSDLPCASGNPAVSNTVNMVVDPNVPVSVTISVSENPVCSGSAVTFTAFPVNGGAAPSYQWVVNLVNIPGATDVTFNYIPADNDAVCCILTSSLEHTSGNPATSNTITITLNPQLIVVNMIAADANPVCEGSQVNFLAVPFNGGTSPLFQWQVNSTDVPGATDAAYGYVPDHGDVVTCMLTSSELCTQANPVLSNPITMMVNPSLPVSIAIQADVNPVCTGTTVNFTAIPVNGGATPGYQWMVNSLAVSGATNPTYSFNPANQDVVTCELTSDIVCGTGSPAISNEVVMTVNQLLPVSVSIAADAGTVCSGVMVNYMATPVNGGEAPAYQWMVNSSTIPGATSSTYSYVPVNGDNVQCVLTSSATCISGNPASSNTIVMVVNQAPVPGISGTNATCAGTSNLLYMTEPGMTGYSWTISAGGTITFNAGAAVFVTWHTAGNQWLRVNYTGSNGCSAATPTQHNVTVNALPVPVISGATSSCAGTAGVVYTTEPGMSNYAWSLSPGGTNTSGGTSASNTMTVTWNTAGEQWVRVSYTSAAGCPAASPTTLNVLVSNPVPASVGVTASENPVNAGVPVTFTASAVNGGSTPGYQWRVNGADVSGATNATYTYVPLNNDAVSCVMTSSLACVSGSPATSNTVVMIVNGIPVNLTVQNVTVGNLETTCYNALDTILVAGGSTTFLVENGGTANFIAGKSIRYLPGSKVVSGGIMTGKIAPSGPFCDGVMPPVASVISGVEPSRVTSDQTLFTIYPNPTSGNFTLALKGKTSYQDLQVEILTMTGESIHRLNLTRERKHDFSLSEVPAGLYFVKVIALDYTETIKLIKTK